MADFGDPSLFSEFEKPKGPSDKLLKQNVLAGGKSQGLADISQEEDDFATSSNSRGKHTTANEAGRKSSSSSDDSDGGASEDSDNENDIITTRNIIGNGAVNSQAPNSSGMAGGLVGDNARNEELLKTIKKLKSENDFLKRQVRLFDPLLWIKDEPGPMMQLIFMHHDFAREHKAEIEGFVASLVAEAKTQKKGGMGVVRPRPNDTCLASVKDMTDPMRRILRIRTSMIMNCSQVYEDFIIDMMGSPLVDFNPALSDGWEIPIYEQVFPHSLPHDEEDEDVCPQRKFVKKKTACFNCGGEHIISKCPEEKDFERIRRNKKEFMGNSTPKQERYHVEDPRFATFKAGVLSESLRSAMGLSPQQLPPYIYQMRQMGYPPGWLEEAKKETGLAMYDRQGRELDNEGELLEDGEMNEERVVVRDEYHIEKFVEYPGFNAPLPSGAYDEWQQFGAIPQQPGQNIEDMKKLLGGTPTGTKRKTEGETNGSTKRRKHTHLDLSTSDMDLANSDGEEGGLPSSQASTAPSTPSMSIDELEKQRELLRQELLDSNEDSSQETIPVPSTPVRIATNDPEEPNVGTVLSSTPSAPSIGSSLGTPILSDIGDKRSSLPDPSKFRKDIEDHIPFENLPGHEGTFEKFRVILGKIKEEKKKL